MELEIEILPKESCIPKKLVPKQIQEIITMFSQHKVADIAAKFGVTRTTIDKIRRRNVKNITMATRKIKSDQGPGRSYSDDEW